MKKIASILLVFALLLSLASCTEEPVKTKEKNEEDISRLSAEELYALGCEKNEGLLSAEFETLVTDESGESFSVKTVRIREGYEGFRLSRVSEKEEVYFYGEKAFQKNKAGAFTAPSAARVFREFLENYVYPIGAFGAEALFEVEKDGLTLRYTVKNEALLSRFAFLAEGFDAAALEGECTLNEEGILTEETFTVTGTENGEEKSYTLKTSLSRYRSSEIEIQKPESEEGYVLLGDIRLPGMLSVATRALREKRDVQVTFVSGNTLLVGEKEYSFHSEITAYQTVGEDEKDLAYLTKQSLKTVPDAELESRFYQRYIAGGLQKENSYDVVTAALLSENETESISLPWPAVSENFIPALSDIATLRMVEDSVGYSVTFTLTENARKTWAEKHLADLPEAAVTVDGASFTELEGTFSISREACVTALSYSLEGSVSAGGEAASFRGQYSMNVDALENISVPYLQVPTPTTPGMATDGAVD